MSNSFSKDLLTDRSINLSPKWKQTKKNQLAQLLTSNCVIRCPVVNLEWPRSCQTSSCNFQWTCQNGQLMKINPVLIGIKVEFCRKEVEEAAKTMVLEMIDISLEPDRETKLKKLWLTLVTKRIYIRMQTWNLKILK